VVFPSLIQAQGLARVRAEENFRRDPNGELLAQLAAGTPLTVLSSADGWVEATVDGWVWERSLQVDDREGLDLVVSEAEGENLRDAPSGNILGRLEGGTLLEEIEREPGWIHVRRHGWIWEASVVLTESEDGAAQMAPDEEQPAPAARRPGGFAPTGPGGAIILGAPDGDTLAVAVAGSELEMVAREGNWVRVRIEGWTWMPETDSVDAESEGDVLTPEALVADPSAHRGRMVAWTLQFISLEEAERVRTDFFEGEPFLLCRFGGTDGPFVYVAVPPERVVEVEGLVPLELITVTGRVRTGASALTGTPIVDLIVLERARDEP
jgi:hypothetical protein